MPTTFIDLVGANVTLGAVAHTADGVDRTTYTFTAVAIGVAASNRLVVVGATIGSTNFPFSSMTIGGITATQAVASSLSVGSQAAIYYAIVPTGTTADIVITAGGGVNRCAIGVWPLYDANPTPFDTGFSSANPMSDTLNIPAGGIAIGIARNIASATYTWTGITEDFDGDIVDGSATQTGASKLFPTAQSLLAITCTPSSYSEGLMAIASWGPA